MSVAALRSHVSELLGHDGEGEVHDDELREALVDALAGRYAARGADLGT